MTQQPTDRDARDSRDALAGPQGRDERPRWPRVASRGLLALVVVLTVATISELAARRADRLLRQELLTRVRMAAGAIAPRHLAALTGTVADLESADYAEIKEQLTRIRRAEPRSRFVYLMGRRADGQVFFYTDSEPTHSPDYSAPGEIYEEVTAALLEVFAHGREVVEGPIADRWGQWVTAFVPLADQDRHGQPVVFGIDIAAEDWHAAVAARAAIPTSIATVAVLLAVLAFLLYRTNLALAAREATLRMQSLVLAQIRDQVTITDLDGRVTYVNDAECQLLHKSREELVGAPWAAYDEDSAGGVPQAEIIRRTREAGHWRGEAVHLAPDGARVLLDCRTQVVRDGDGEPVALCGIATDITKRKESEERITELLQESTEARVALLGILEDEKRAWEAARESEQRWRSYMEHAPYGVFLADEQGRYLRVNPAACEMSGYDEAELLSRSISDLLAPESRVAALAGFAELGREGKYSGEFAYHPKSGETRWWSVAAVKLSDTRFLAFKQDITERHRAEAELKRIAWMLRSGRDDARTRGPQELPEFGDVVALASSRVILDAVGQEMLAEVVRDCLEPLSTSAAVYEANGDYAFDADSSGWCRLLDEASRRQCGTDDNAEALASGRWRCHESCWIQASKVAVERGQPVDLECAGGLRLYAVPIRGGGRVVGAMSLGYGDPPREPAKLAQLAADFDVELEPLAETARAYETRPPFVIEIAKRRLESAARLIGEIVERKRAEDQQARLQTQLLQAQKMELVGRLAGGVAHDFNNLLMGMMNYVELCRDEVPADHPARPWLDEITTEAQRSAHLVQQLLAFARKQVIAPKTLDLNETVPDLLKMLRRLIGEDINLVWTPGPGLWPVHMDPIQINQLLANLAVNARHAMVGVGTLTCETRNVVVDDPGPGPGGEGVPGEYVVLTVSDTGCGIDEQTLPQIFEPFFTTKEVGEGTGLGLATVYGIVEQNGGFIRVASRPGQGTTFRVYLPRQPSPTAASPPDTTPTQCPRGDETVLLVEDERSVRVTVERILDNLGYTVLAAESPEEGLRLATEHRGSVHLLVTDVIMPGMNGRDLARCLLETHPEIKCLFMSGYPSHITSRQDVLDDSMRFLQKPFSMHSLATALREVLEP